MGHELVEQDTGSASLLWRARVRGTSWDTQSITFRVHGQGVGCLKIAKVMVWFLMMLRLRGLSSNPAAMEMGHCTLLHPRPGHH